LPHPAPDYFGAATKSGSKPLTVSPSLNPTNDLRTRHCGSPPMDPCLASLARILPPSIACHFAHRDVRSMPIKFSHFSPTLPQIHYSSISYFQCPATDVGLSSSLNKNFYPLSRGTRVPHSILPESVWMLLVHIPTESHALHRQFSMRTSLKKSNLLGRKGSSSHQLVRIRDRGPAENPSSWEVV